MNALLKMKRDTLTFFAKNTKKNKGKNYIQTWYHMPPLWSKKNHNIPKHHLIGWPLLRTIQFICGIIGGHELSKTEWGYGGGKYADRWCRWCNKMIQVPKESVFFRFPNSKHMMDTVEKKHGSEEDE